MKKNKISVGDLVEIVEVETDFKAHMNGLTGKLAIVIMKPDGNSILDIWRIYLDGFETPILGKHLRKVGR
jgi:hypothetical protein